MPKPGIAVGNHASVLAAKIHARTARVGVVGLGYVGLPLAVEFAKAGFHVTGVDVSEWKTSRVKAGIITDHAALVERAVPIVDCRNALRGMSSPKAIRL